jgi:Holliday junction resolvase-like predicted endonuclease
VIVEELYRLMGRAGKSIRAMAWDYKKQGACSWALAAGFLGVTVGLSLLLKFSLAVPLYWVGLGVGLVFFFRGSMLFRQAARADQGAKGEEEVAKILRQFPSGWKTEFNRRVYGVGDVDVIVRSPRGKTWTVDVKSHQGKIVEKEGKLYKVIGRNTYPFQKDFIAAAKRQALLVLVRSMDHLRYVTPVICFSSAKVEIENSIEGVYVISRYELLDFFGV